MDLKQELKDRLGVPENWDKHDYQTQRYSFNDVQEVLEGIVKKLTTPAVIESTTGYSCPNCGAICSEQTIVSKTEAIFEELPDPHYSWDETHKCQNCETIYTLENGT